MKEFVSNLGIFVVLTLVFSSLNGCSGTTTNSNAPNPPGKPSAPSADSGKNSAYPPLPSGLADTQLEMLDGTKSKVSDHKGKVLILNLWAIWCGPCRDEMPHLADMQRKYGNERLEVISLNIGDYNGNPEPIASIQKFATDMKIDYTLGRIPIADAKPFNLLTKQSGIPQTVIVDGDGHLRGVFFGGGQNVFNSLAETLEKVMSDAG